MSSLLLRHIDILVTMDVNRREISDGAIYAKNGWIEKVGKTNELPSEADSIIDLSGHIVLPGLINTHHHLYQTLTRAVPEAQNADLFKWLIALYPLWARLTPSDLSLSTQLGLAELALSGCTTTLDHPYIFPNGCRLDDEIEAARIVGIRFHAARGSMSMGESQGGLPIDQLVETEAHILKDSQRLIEAYHDSSPGAMIRIVLAPCAPTSVSSDLLRETAKLGRSYNVFLHTHLAETVGEQEFCLELYKKRLLDYLEELEWVGRDVSYAHAVHMNTKEIERLSKTGTTVAHCPTSNMRLGSGIAPIIEYLEKGIPVGLGVDGSASNDSSHMLSEVRQAMLLARLNTAIITDKNFSQNLLTPRQAIELATIGGAKVLGREDIGSLEPGKCADCIAIHKKRIEYSGALHDFVAAIVLCTPVMVDYNFVHGSAIVKEGQLTTLDLGKLIDAHNRAAFRLRN
ncbi:MAG: 8-oxoguanine deaminase [Pelolinea sp.]|nr:8-oxoguanine deaminase [Pelolinea sp.]